jgi:hypothetical protein
MEQLVWDSCAAIDAVTEKRRETREVLKMDIGVYFEDAEVNAGEIVAERRIALSNSKYFGPGRRIL